MNSPFTLRAARCQNAEQFILSLLIATLCTTLPGPPYCIEEMVAKLPYQVCTTQAQFTLAPWLASGKYAENWRIEKFKCEDTNYVVKGRA